MSRIRVVNCGSCVGIGYLDSNGSSPCEICKGTGKTLIESNATFQEDLSLSDQLRATKQVALDSMERHLKLRQKVIRLENRISDLRKALQDWLVSTPTDKDGNYDPINQSQAVNALRAISLDEIHAKNEEIYQNTGLSTPSSDRV